MDRTVTDEGGRTDHAEGDLIVERAGGIARVIFNRPDRLNAMTFASWKALAEICTHMSGEDGLRVVTFEGAGDRAFVSGADISEFDAVRASPETASAYDTAVHDALEGIAGLPVPTLALVDGYCIGGGLEIALSCDLRIASSRATFAVTPAKLGLGFSYEGVALIRRVAGEATAADLLYSGRRVPAGDAHAMRLCERVLDKDTFSDEARGLAEAIAANAPLTIRAVKAALVDLRKAPADRDRSAADALIAACIDSEDYLEGRRAFAEKRTPRFKGA